MLKGLERLLYPISTADFLAENYEISALHITERAENSFEDVFSFQAAEALLWQQEKHIPHFVRVHNNGQDQSPTRDINSLNYVRWVIARYQEGASLVINNLEDYELPVAALARDIELQIEARVSASAYLTPKNARAFRVHFDTHDVLILQIQGSKKYNLYEQESLLHLPLARQAYTIDASILGPPSDEIVLNPGDVLYIPRGLIHVANTDDRPSLHISLGFHPAKVCDLIKTAIDIASERKVNLRQSLAVKNTLTDQKDYLEVIISELSKILEVDIDGTEVLERERQKFVASLRLLPDEQLASEASASSLQLTDYVTKTAGSVCALSKSTTTVRLTFSGLRVERDNNRNPSLIEAPVEIAPALEMLAERTEPFALIDLPGPLSDTSKLVLGRKLIREGLLKKCSTHNSGINDQHHV